MCARTLRGLILWLPLLVLLAPVVALVLDAIGGWPLKLNASRVAGLTVNTLALAISSAAFAAFWGCAAAWLVETCEFAARRFFAVALFLPFAVPPYLLAYIWADLIDDSGVLPAGYGIRNLLGAAFIMSLVLYPYVYMLARAAFAQRSCGIMAASRLLGCTPLSAFWRVALPLARPAVALGALLVFMETVNDIAIAEDFGLATLGLQVLDLWQLRDDRSTAAGVALLLLIMVVLLSWAESFSRRRQRQYQLAQRRYFSETRYRLTWPRQLAAVASCGLLLALAFVIPMLYLLSKVAYNGDYFHLGLGAAALDSIWIVLLVGAVTFTLGGLLVAIRNRQEMVSGLVAKLAMAGYALPGSVYALGCFLAATAIADTLMQYLNISIHWIWANTLFLLVVAMACRFVIIAAGAIEAGQSMLPPRLVTVARNGGWKFWERLIRIYLPIYQPALAAGLMLLVVDVLKELPLTLLLRPFGVTPLSLQIYQYAADEDLGRAAAPALILVLATSTSLLIAYRWIVPTWYKTGNEQLPATDK